MSRVLVDTNIILDVAGGDPKWALWSSRQIERFAADRLLTINPVIYAEVSVGFASSALVDDAFPESIYERENIPYEAAFLAGKAFVEYRRRGGTRRSPLPDFFIGAHAAVSGHRLLTRDPKRYRAYFPAVKLICPE